MQFIQTIFKILTKYGNFYAEGVRNTLIISLMAVFFGTLLGALMALARMSRVRPLRWLATAYIEFFRGTPLMVQLTFIFYGLPMVGITFPDVPFIPDFSRFMAGVVAMSLNSCAYVAEVIRSGIQAVDPGQMEAARCLGLSGKQSMLMVVLPQAVRNILPALGNEFITVVKESSVVSVIGIADLMYRTNGVKAKTYNVLECLATAAIIYFVLTFTFSKIVAWTERRMAHGRK